MGGVFPNESGVLLRTRKYRKSPGLEPYSSEELNPPSEGEPQMEALDGRVSVSDTEPCPLLDDTLTGLVVEGKWDTGSEAERAW